MGYKEEIKRVVLNHLLDKYLPGEALGETHYAVGYRYIRARQIAETIDWKIKHLTTVQ